MMFALLFLPFVLAAALPPEVTTLINVVTLGYAILLVIAIPYALFRLVPAALYLMGSRGRSPVERQEKLDDIKWIIIGAAIVIAAPFALNLLIHWLENGGITPHVPLVKP